MAGTNPHSWLKKAAVYMGGVTGVSAAGVFDSTEFDSKTTPLVTDKVVIQDVAVSNLPKTCTLAQFCKGIATTLDGTTAASGIAGNATTGALAIDIANTTGKTTPIAADSVMICDSEDTSSNKSATITNLTKAVADVIAGVHATTGLVDSAGVITVAAKIPHVEAAIVTGMRDFTLSFVTANQMATKIYFNKKVTINLVRAIVTTAIAASDNGTITCADATGDMAGGVVTCVASAPVGTEYSATPTTHNVIAKDGYMKLTTLKTTTGGEVLVSVEYTVTA
jgi:hypothetical protein